jgi:quercetin dioxygenase-like cupin family protein
MITSYSNVRVTEPYPGLTRRVLAHNAKIMLVEHIMQKGSVFPLHQHPHEQLAYVIKGRLLIECGNDKYTVTEGDSWVIPGGVSHRVTALDESIALDIFTPAREDYL